ncbi:hypothetical protein G6F40_014318 [Rhizopus arrhizus]|nr:hypothetical protein G6F40_014318 [Rhizopus arrhizus]
MPLSVLAPAPPALTTRTLAWPLLGVEQQGAPVAGEGIDVEGVEGAAVAECDGAGVAQGEGADGAVAGHQPGAVAADVGRGDVGEAAIDLRLVAQDHIERTVGNGGGIKGHVAGKTRIVHGEVDVGAGVDWDSIANQQKISYQSAA